MAGIRADARTGVRVALAVPLAAGLAAGLALAAAAPAGAQVVTGRVVDRMDRTPIDGAMVWLLDEQERPRGQVLTNERGAFIVTAPDGGFYKLRADRIGHASSFSELFQVMAGDTVFVAIEAEVEAIQLAAIDVEADRQCRIRPEAGEATAIVWEEARKALAAAAWTTGSGVYLYELTYYTRDLDRDARQVEREETRRSSVLRQRTFVSRPADDLVESGFVQRDGNDYVYYAPDAEVLLSDDFLDSHCLELRAGRRDSEGLIGIGFSPVRGRGVPDIDGTLWLDPVTSELRFLDFRYINLESGIRDDNVGGRVEFQPLPAGPWIVRRWSIRMPYVASQRPFGTAELRNVVVGLHEEGAQVTQVRDRGGDLLLEFETGMVVGSVRSRYGVEPVEGATVSLVGTNWETLTDAEGDYRLSGLEDGEYTVTFRHASLDSLGYQVEPVPVNVVQGTPAVVNFLAPNRWEILTSICRDDDVGVETAALVGWVEELSTGETLPGAQVTVTWTGYEIEARGATRNQRASSENPATYIVRGDVQGFQVTTNSDGLYVACGVPSDQLLDVQASFGNVEGRSVRIRIPRDALAEHRNLSLRVGSGAPAGAPAAEDLAGLEARAREIVDGIERRAGPRVRVEERMGAGIEYFFCVQGGRRTETEMVSGCSGAVLIVDGAIAQEGMGQQGVAAARILELFTDKTVSRVRVLTAREAEFELGQLGEAGAVMVETRDSG